MNSFVQTNEQTALDFNTIIPKIREHSKSYTFFIYYLRSEGHPNSPHLQRLAFRLKQQKIWGLEKAQNGRMVQLFFVDLDNEHQTNQSFFDIKQQQQESLRIKLIFYAHQSHLIQIITKANDLGIDLLNSPSALYSPSINADLSQHLGWRQSELGDLSLKASSQFEPNVRKWISSPGQKIDLWSVNLSVDPSEGVIYKLQSKSSNFLPIHEKTIRQSFLSHLSIGHHAELAAMYQKNRKEDNHSFVNKVIFNFESFKKFCCLGKPSLQSSTGVISIIFRDEKGHEQQITKDLQNQQGKKGIMSLVFSNIDKFQGTKLHGGRLSDSKLEMGVFQSSSEQRFITSLGGSIVVKFKTNSIFIQVNSSCFRLVEPLQLSIKLQRKVRVLINKDTLEC